MSVSPPPMDSALLAAGRQAKGFMPEAEGLALYRAAARAGPEPIVEIGTYCGKSAVFLAAGARLSQTVLFTIDHHRGSEEMQTGWDNHDSSLVDGTGRINSLPEFRRLVDELSLHDVIVGVVGDAAVVGASWNSRASLVFIDGGHGPIPAHADYDLWAPHVATGGVLAIHDVFPDPADGGRPPYEIYCRALESEMFEDLETVGSLRLLRRVS
ncbi:MAG: class I SAM-dependent methyltransferase [Actinomycetia bacterium]|nr:class I SAM-dependent methyltransferase [Actinomycetes bacterium]MCP4961845.1 class I SAM-dependent methyltransferase [Actinomycetes bacterium]